MGAPGRQEIQHFDMEILACRPDDLRQLGKTRWNDDDIRHAE
jgi:hypothetical protein